MMKSLLMGSAMLLLAFVLQPTFAQMNNWGLIPNKIDFSTAPPTSSTMVGATAPAFYEGYNAMWDDSGNLLFYIVGGGIFNPSNSYVGFVSQPTASYTSGAPPHAVTLIPRQDAFHIVPAPGSTTRYYVFHTAYGGFSGVGLVYTIVDCPTPGTVIVTNPAGSRLYDTSIGNSSVIAITKPRIDNSRYLFFFGGGVSGGSVVDLINYFVITPSGITVPASNTVYTTGLNTALMEAVDAEVYEDQDGYTLAWCTQSYEKFNALKLTSSLAVSASYNYPLPSGNIPANIEFSADGKDIYATVGGFNKGVYKTSITGSPALISGSANYAGSQIELAKDGLFYLANTSGQLSTLDPATNTFAVSPMGITLTSTYFVVSSGYIYTLPEQLDQENYSCLTSQPCIPYNVKINYVIPATQACPSPYGISGCGSASFSASHSIAPAYYMLDFQSLDGSCVIAPGSDKIHYNSGWVAGAPPSIIGDLMDVNGNSIATTLGKIRITYSVKNSCGSVRSVVSNITNNSPTVGLTDFKLNNTLITSSCATPYNVFSCSTPSLQILPIQKNTPSVYQLTIQAVDASCNTVNGAGLITYNSGWVSGGIVPNTDILTLTDGNGVSLTGYNGLVLITYSVKDVCGYVTYSVNHKVRMNGAPSPASTELTLNSYTSVGTPVAAALTAPGVSMGLYSGSINLTSSAAVFSSYEIMIDEVDCSTGSVIGNICDITTALGSPVTSLTSINLNTLNVPAIPAKSWAGGPGFFAMKGFGSCFVINASPINVCGSTTVSSYISPNCYCRIGSAEEGLVIEERESAFYPTIFEEDIYADYILEGSENIVTVKIYDLRGILISTPVEGLSQNKGENHLTIRVPAIPAGTYIVALEANGVKHSQLMIKK